jgi:APA family basic amino acid/polyamine antiporter
MGQLMPLDSSSSSFVPKSQVSGLETAQKPKFARVLDIFSLTFLGLGATIGGGVFTLSGIAAKKAASDVWISWLVSGIVVSITALAYAELSNRIQKSGSSYIYTYIIYGEIMAFMIAWNMLQQYGISTSA